MKLFESLGNVIMFENKTAPSLCSQENDGLEARGPSQWGRKLPA